MKHKTLPLSFVIVFAATFLTSTALVQRADAACSYARTAGTYGFSDSGTIIGLGARAAAGILTFDASGNVQGPVTASLNGVVSQTTLSGSYTVNGDCSGSASFAELDQSGNVILTATVNIFWDNNVRDARFIFTSVVLANGTALSTVINGSATKQIP